MVNLIPCAQKCRYQQDGYCQMEGSGLLGQAEGDQGCIYFRPLDLPQSAQSIIQIPGTDELDGKGRTSQ